VRVRLPPISGAAKVSPARVTVAVFAIVPSFAVLSVKVAVEYVSVTSRKSMPSPEEAGVTAPDHATDAARRPPVNAESV
jgi:hypothetical protein